MWQLAQFNRKQNTAIFHLHYILFNYLFALIHLKECKKEMFKPFSINQVKNTCR